MAFLSVSWVIATQYAEGPVSTNQMSQCKTATVGVLLIKSDIHLVKVGVFSKWWLYCVSS